MFIRALKHITYANVMATLAFFIAVSGTAYAAVQIPAHSVGTKQLKPASVGTKQLKPASVGTKQLKPASVGTEQLKPVAVGTEQLKPVAVGTEQLKPGSVDATQLAANSVGPASLQANAVGSDQLAPASVGNREVKPGSLRFDAFESGQVSPRLFAHARSIGTLETNSGVTSLTRESKGIYLFRFNRDIRSCVPVANVGLGSGPGVILAGATAQSSLVGTDGVRVTVFWNGFTFNNVEDNDINLIVMC